MRRLRVASRTAFFKDLPDLIKVISVFFGFLLGRDDDPGWKIRNKKESAGFDRRSCCSGRVTKKKKRRSRKLGPPWERSLIAFRLEFHSISLDFTRFRPLRLTLIGPDCVALRRRNQRSGFNGAFFFFFIIIIIIIFFFFFFFSIFVGLP